MTTEDKIYADAIEYRTKYWKNRGVQVKEAAEFGYIVGSKSILESEEYIQMAADVKNYRLLKEKFIQVRSSYTDEEWIDPTIKGEINADIRWAAELVTKYEVNW